MIFAYNKEHVGDTLLVITENDHGLEQTVTRKLNVARIQTTDGTIIGWNFFHISNHLTIDSKGQVELTEEQVTRLNELINEAGFAETLIYDSEPKFVVGYVKTCEKHPDSDHLSITETQIDGGKTLQIVCGAPNIKAGLKVVVAKPGAMMPDGLLIWPGMLRGVESYGMICSARELHLPNAPEKKGILELPEDAVVGEVFPVNR